MSIWDNIKDWATGGAQDDMSKYYQQGQGYLQPYQQGGADSFNNWRSRTDAYGNMLDSYGNPADYSWRQINQSPMSYYNNIMNSYQESPEAKYAQEQALRSGNAAAAASGMMGSGAYASGIQRNANDISQQDRGNYYGRVMQANQAQQQSLENYQRQRMWNDQMLQNQSMMGLQAGSQMSQNAMNEGNQQAYWDDKGMTQLGGLGDWAMKGGLAGIGKNLSQLAPYLAQLAPYLGLL